MQARRKATINESIRIELWYDSFADIWFSINDEVFTLKELHSYPLFVEDWGADEYASISCSALIN